MSGFRVTEKMVPQYRFEGIARGPEHVKASVGGPKFRQLLVRYFAVKKLYEKKLRQRLDMSPSGPYGQGPTYREVEAKEDMLSRAMGSLIEEMKAHGGFGQRPDISRRSKISENGFYIRVAEGKSAYPCEENEVVRGSEILQRQASDDLGGNRYRLVAEQK